MLIDHLLKGSLIMICPKCNFENPDEATYCINCGSRVDGKILCPKCKEPISPDVDICPHCRHKIPHQSVEETPVRRRGEKPIRIFTRLFAIFAIGLFAFAMIFSFGRYYSAVPVKNDGYAINLIFRTWFSIYDRLSSTHSWLEWSAELTKTILSCVIVVVNIAVTITFGIMGIVRATKYLNGNAEKYGYAKFLAIVGVSNLLSMVFFRGFGETLGGFWISLNVAFIFILLGAIFIFNIFKTYFFKMIILNIVFIR